MPAHTLRSRVWTLLRAARKGVAVATLAATLGTTPEAVLAAMLADMLEPAPGKADPPIYCDPHGPTLVARDMTPE